MLNVQPFPERYRVTETNTDPSLLSFAIPVDIFDLYRYVARHNLIEYSENFNRISPMSAPVTTQRLSEEVEHEHKFVWPFEAVTNYATDDKLLVDEGEEDATEMVAIRLFR